MPVVSEMVHPDGLSFHQQKRVVLLRDVEGLSFAQIAKKVKNLKGKLPSKQLVSDVYNGFDAKKARRPSAYKRCGRTAYKVTPEVEAFLVRKVVQLRRKCVCTSVTLQQELAREMNLHLTAAYIRKILVRKGYKWLPRSGKPKYSSDDKAKRIAFAQNVVEMTQTAYENHLALAMDGVVLSLPPTTATDRENYCRIGETHMWRKPSEAGSEDVDGGSGAYGEQVPLGRAVPLWGGIAKGGFAVVCYHDKRKLSATDWQKNAVRSGRLVAACKKVRPDRQRGPWNILCDNESFLDASRAAHDSVGVRLWHIPPRSPDLNPVEKYWSWLRRQLRAMDLADLVAKRRPVTKTALKARVRTLCSSQRAKVVAQRCA